MKEKDSYNSNIIGQRNMTSLSLLNDNNARQISNDNIQFNNFNQIQQNINSNLNINNIVSLLPGLNNVRVPIEIEENLGQNINVNNQNINSEFPLIEEKNQNKEALNNINNQNNNIYNFNNNYYNNNINNFFLSGNNKSTKPYFTSKHVFLNANSLNEVNDCINKDLTQLEKFLPNYKYYITNNNYESINICLKYISFSNFFFNQTVSNRVIDIFKAILFADNKSYEMNNHNNEFFIFKKKIKELYKKLIPFEIRMKYLSEFYEKNCEKKLYVMFKDDLNKYQRYEDKKYYLYEIFEIVKQKMDIKDKEEIKNYFNKIFHNSKNNNNYNNNSFLNGNNGMNNEKNGGNNYNNYHNNNSRQYRKYSYQSPNAQNRGNNSNFSNYDNNTYKNNGSSFHHINYNNNKNNNLYMDNEDKGYKNNHDNSSHHHNSSFQRNNNYKGSFSSRHYFNNTNNNNKNSNLRNKGNRKSSYAGILVEVDSNPKNLEENNSHIQNKKEEENNKIIINSEDEKEQGKINGNEENENQIFNKEDPINNEINIVNNEEIDLENNLNINNENSKKGNALINEDEKLFQNDGDFEAKDENLFNVFNSINPFNENVTSSEESAKEESNSQLLVKKSQSDNNIINLNINNNLDNKDQMNKIESHSVNNNQEENKLIENIINESQNNIINSSLYENNMNFIEKEATNDLYKNDINLNEDKKDNKDIQIEKNINNINNINIIDKKISDNKESRSPSPKKISLSDNNIINVNQKKKNNSSNLNISLKNNSINNINNNNLMSNNAINNNLTNDQLQLLKLLMIQNNNLLNNLNQFHNQQTQINSHNSNLNSLQINNNINNNNSIYNHNINNINLLNNINPNFNLFNNFYSNIYQNYNTIFFNYWNDENNFLSNLRNNSINIHSSNYNNNINYLNKKSDKLLIEYNQIKKYEKENPEKIEEFKNLFEEKIILPKYIKINEDSQLKKEFYTEIYNKYKNIITKILSKHNLEDVKVEPFGSIVNNFMTECGDIDICIVPKDNNLIQSFWEYLEEIKDEVINIQKIAKCTLIERYPRFLILKLKDIETNIDLDITVQNLLSITNSKLIRLYSLLDQRFHIFGIFLKLWVKKNKINGALDKFLSSYALLILIIHYLQNIAEPKILPILQQIQNVQKEYIYYYEGKELKTNLYFEEDIEKINNYMNIINDRKENNSSVVELLIGFFDFYAYKYDHYLISISKSDKKPLAEDETIAFPIEDPFDVNYNPGKSMKLNTFQYAFFIYCMKKELNNILSGEYFKLSVGE